MKSSNLRLTVGPRDGDTFKEYQDEKNDAGCRVEVEQFKHIHAAL